MTRRLRAPIVQERVLPAPPEDVFQAWSDPESLRHWMLPAPDMTRADVAVDFRVGGRFRIAMQGAERLYEHHGEFLEIVRPKRLVMTWISEWMPPEVAKTLVTVSLEPTGDDETRLVLVHEDLPEGFYDGHVGGWAEIVRKLGVWLQTVR